MIIRTTGIFLIYLAGGCPSAAEPGAALEPPVQSQPSSPFDEERKARAAMVQRQLQARDIRDPLVLAAMGRVPRHALIPEDFRRYAYADQPLPIGLEQTISQPYMVAAMTQAAGVTPTSRVLEIGTGSGYQAAVLAEIAQVVYTVEIVAPLGERAKTDLTALGYDNIHYRIGDGYQGWAEHGPYDAIVVTAAPPKLPEPLVEQLKIGGRLIIPVGDQRQDLLLIQRTPEGVVSKRLMGVLFVPMTGTAQQNQ